MTRVLEYDNHYNTEHWEYWATKMKMFCKPGEITDGCLVLSEEDGYGWILVDLQIVKSYEYDGVIYDVRKMKNGKFKITKRGEQQ